MNNIEPPTREDFSRIINYLKWKTRQLTKLTKSGRLEPVTCVKLQTGVSLLNSLVWEDLDHLVIKGELHE